MNTLNDTNGTSKQNGFQNTDSSATAPVEAPAIASDEAIAALRRLTADLRLRPTLAVKELREITWALRVPTELVRAMIATAERFPAEVGHVFDRAAIGDALDKAERLEAIAAEGRHLVAHADDEARRLRAKASSDAWAGYQALRGIARTSGGTALREAVRTLRGVARSLTMPRRGRSSGAASPAAPTGESPGGPNG